MKKFVFPTPALLALAVGVYAVETQFWEQSDQPDYEKATLNGISVRSDGRLSLAPVFQEVFEASTPYIWSLAEDSKGNVYAGGGGSDGSTAELFVVDAKGTGKVLAALDGLQIHAIAVDKNNRVYAGTSPDGKVYRISPSGDAQVFYDPRTKYIWGLAFDSQGNLFVATGDAGEIHKVTPKGEGSVFFRTEETHARSLAIDSKNNLIAGTEPSGLIFRISPNAEGFVLYQGDKREITSIALGGDGFIYAAGVGTKQAPAIVPKVPPVLAPPPTAPSKSTTQIVPAQRPGAAPPLTLSAPVAVSGGSEVYRIDTEGYPRTIWSDTQEIAYALAFDDAGRLLIGTGNKGNLYRVDSEVLSTLLVNAPPTQITALVAGRGGRVYAATGNIGTVYRVGPELQASGSVESDVFDSGGFSYWGRLWFDGQRNGGKLSFTTRSGNLDRPQQNWSSWASVSAEETGGRIASPAARFVQWRLELALSPDNRSPEVSTVEVAYLPKNVAPVVEKIEATPANYRYPQTPAVSAENRNLTLAPLSRRRRPASSASITPSEPSSTLNYSKGYVGARWLASDENGDELTYKVEIRGVRESEWKLLKENVSQRHISWDSTAYADGEYVLRVTASDLPDNSPAGVLTGSLVSPAFLIDNTPPAITGLTASRTGKDCSVSWTARDKNSIVERAEYSLDGGDWLVAAPESRLSDASELSYKLTLKNLPQGEHTIAVRVTDAFGNQAVGKVIVR